MCQMAKNNNPQEALPRVKLNDLNKVMAIKQEPVVILYEDKDKFIVFPYNASMERSAVSLAKQYIKGEVSWDEYRKQLMIQGLENLQNNKVLVTPGHIIASESVEETKKKNKLLATSLLMDAAKFWAGHAEWHMCPNCGHQMLPESVVKAVKGKESNDGVIESVSPNA